MFFIWFSVFLLTVISQSEAQSLIRGRPPTFVTVSKSLTVSEKASFNLDCTAEGSEPISYRWTKDGQPLLSSFPPRNLYSVPSANKADAGLYQCTASNAFGSVLSSTINVTVACEYFYLIRFEKKDFFWTDHNCSDRYELLMQKAQSQRFSASFLKLTVS